jgi:ATP-dependent DNA ligase
VASTDALLDDEVIAGNGSIESFKILLRRARLRGRSTSSALPVSFVAFDLLWHDGADLTQRPLEERRTQLLVYFVIRFIYYHLLNVCGDFPALPAQTLNS